MDARNQLNLNGVRFGVDRLMAGPEQVAGRLGLVTNDAARLAADSQIQSRLALQRAGFRMVRLFSPEHGLATSAADGVAVGDDVDRLTGLPVVSLYGEQLRPPHAALTDLDVVLFDLPDVGARFYTYIWTLSHVLEACAETGVPLFVLDRPNPLGGDLAAAEGPVLEVEKFASFLGRAAMPIRHSLTVGELARWWSAEWKLDVKLQVIRCEGWRRAMYWPDTGLPFVPTSPAITSYEAALCYPGLCLFEAANLSLGRGTPLSFQAIGAPWLRAEETARRFNGLVFPGVSASAQSFLPNIGPHAGERCAAVRLTVSHPKSFRPVGAGLHLLAIVIEQHRTEFRWANYPTTANPTGEGHFEWLIGRADSREALAQGAAHIYPLVAGWTDAGDWAGRMKPFLLYD